MEDLVLFFILFSLPLFAQERLQTIEVSESGPLLQEVSTPIRTTSESTMQESTSLNDVLSQIPGVVTTQSGGFGGQGSVFLRGSEARHTLVLTDGMRLNDSSIPDRSFDTAFLLTAFFQELLLLQGPSPALYGGDATSGVLELVPRRGSDRPETIVGLGAGSFETRQGFALQDWKTKNHRGSFGLAHLKTRGFSRLGRKRYGASEPDGAETSQFMQASKHQWSARWQTDLLVYGQKNRAEQDDTFVATDTDDHTKNTQGTVVQTTRHQFENGEAWLRTGLVSNQRDLSIASFGNPQYQGQTRDARAGVKFQLGRFETLTGLGMEQEWLKTDDFHASNDLAHIFLLQRLNPGKWLFEFGGRGEHHQRYGKFFTHEGTVRYSATDELSAYGKSARGYKSPSLFQLYAPGSFGGNPGLTPEFNHSLEVGASWKREGEIDLVVFQQDFQDLILYDTTAGYSNGGTLRVRGLEANVLSPEHSWGQIKLTQTFLDYSHYQAPPLRRPPFLGQISWLGTWGKLQSELSARWVGGRKDTGNRKMEAFEVLSGSLKFQLTESQQLSLKVGNMTDRQYEEVWGFTVAPVNVALQWLGRF